MKKALLAFSVFALPLVSSAQDLDNLNTLADSIGGLINTLVPIVFTLALLYFFWGLADFVRKVGGNEMEEGKNKMIWGLITLFVMASVWGIIKFIGDAFSL